MRKNLPESFSRKPGTSRGLEARLLFFALVCTAIAGAPVARAQELDGGASLPDSETELPEFLLNQSLELHRLSREHRKAMAEIPKYRQSPATPAKVKPDRMKTESEASPAVATSTGGLISGPAPGTVLTPVMVYDTVGPFAGEEFDAAGKIGNNPGALLFVHSMTRNTYDVIRGIDRMAGENALLGFSSFTILLAADRTEAEHRVRMRNGLDTGGEKFSIVGKFGALHLENPIMLSLDGLDGPGNYALNRKAVLTLVMVNGGKVVHSEVFTDTSEKDLPLLERLVSETLDPPPETEKERREILKTRLPRDPAALRALAVRHIAFWQSGAQRPDPMVTIIEEKTGPLPSPHAALVEVIGERLPRDAAAQREMASKQASEVHNLTVRLEAFRDGRLKYQTMKLRPGSQMNRTMSGSRAGDAAARKPNQVDEKRAVTGRGSDPETVASAGPPSDPVLGALLRSFIRKTNSRRVTDSLYSEIQARSRESAGLRQETEKMFRFVLDKGDSYGSAYARTLAKQFLIEPPGTGEKTR